MCFLQAPFCMDVSELLVLNLLGENKRSVIMQIKYVPRVNYCFVCIGCQTRYQHTILFYIPPNRYILFLVGFVRKTKQPWKTLANAATFDFVSNLSKHNAK